MEISEILFKKTDKNIESIEIILIAHTSKPRGSKNNEQSNCEETEIFTIKEFNEIYQGIITAGFFIKNTFFSELEFIKDYNDNNHKYQNNKKNIIIFNLARNGCGLSKKTIIPAFCGLVGLTYTTSDSFSCALARNKKFFSAILAEKNINIPKRIANMEDVRYKTYKGRVVYNKTRSIICKPRCKW